MNTLLIIFTLHGYTLSPEIGLNFPTEAECTRHLSDYTALAHNRKAICVDPGDLKVSGFLTSEQIKKLNLQDELLYLGENHTFILMKPKPHPLPTKENQSWMQTP
jgi:hypothetical protein